MTENLIGADNSLDILKTVADLQFMDASVYFKIKSDVKSQWNCGPAA